MRQAIVIAGALLTLLLGWSATSVGGIAPDNGACAASHDTFYVLDPTRLIGPVLPTPVSLMPVAQRFDAECDAVQPVCSVFDYSISLVAPVIPAAHPTWDALAYSNDRLVAPVAFPLHTTFGMTSTGTRLANVGTTTTARCLISSGTLCLPSSVETAVHVTQANLGIESGTTMSYPTLERGVLTLGSSLTMSGLSATSTLTDWQTLIATIASQATSAGGNNVFVNGTPKFQAPTDSTCGSLAMPSGNQAELQSLSESSSINTVPEPGTCVLLVVAIGALAIRLLTSVVARR
jgi:hypothetical protein